MIRIPLNSGLQKWQSYVSTKGDIKSLIITKLQNNHPILPHNSPHILCRSHTQVCFNELFTILREVGVKVFRFSVYGMKIPIEELNMVSSTHSYL